LKNKMIAEARQMNEEEKSAGMEDNILNDFAKAAVFAVGGLLLGGVAYAATSHLFSSRSGLEDESIMAAVQPDSALSAIVGESSMPRLQITKRLWDYIKTNELQNRSDRKTINTDEKLKALCDGKEKVSIFELGKFIHKHSK